MEAQDCQFSTTITRNYIFPCVRCTNLEKELMMKDQSIRELREKLNVIHHVSATSSDAQNINITSVNVGFSSPAHGSSRGTPAAEMVSRNKPTSSCKSHGMKRGVAGASSGGELNVTIQQIIDRVVERSPNPKVKIEVGNEAMRTLLGRLDADLGKLDSMKKGNSSRRHLFEECAELKRKSPKSLSRPSPKGLKSKKDKSCIRRPIAGFSVVGSVYASPSSTSSKGVKKNFLSKSGIV